MIRRTANMTAVAAAAMLVATPGIADTEKRISETIEAGDLKNARIEIPVGELEIETWDGDEIVLDIEIEARRDWPSFRKKDVDDVELEVRRTGSRIYLGIDDDDLEQHWTVKMPAHLALRVELGVGEIDIEEFANSLDLEVGVGSVRVEVAGTDYDNIHLTSGVGDASIEGFADKAINRRKFISAESTYEGSGEHDMDIEVGVGDVEVRES